MQKAEIHRVIETKMFLVSLTASTSEYSFTDNSHKVYIQYQSY
jgi:hypothetical protein